MHAHAHKCTEYTKRGIVIRFWEEEKNEENDKIKNRTCELKLKYIVQYNQISKTKMNEINDGKWWPSNES